MSTSTQFIVPKLDRSFVFARLVDEPRLSNINRATTVVTISRKR